jgi:SAM-dependent MidA family methyltransferase
MPQTFAEFMRRALYDERDGYYCQRREIFGREGDFFTASQVHDLYGALFAGEFAEVWRGLGAPDFTIVELGAGSGEFAAQALAALASDHPDCFAQSRYVICEISATLRERQRARLLPFAPRVSWIDRIDHLSPITGVFFSNEFFDALPVHLIVERGGRQRELYVCETGEGRLELREGELSRVELEEYWARAGAPLLEGQRAEICLEAARWIKEIGARLARGRVVTVDYGDLAPRLYTADRPGGTLRGFHRHTLSDDPLARVGEQDLTASVNFTALIEYGREAGLAPRPLARLTDHLIGRGLLERAATLAATVDQSPRSLARRLALKQLFLPQGLAGYFKVLVQEKN